MTKMVLSCTSKDFEANPFSIAPNIAHINEIRAYYGKDSLVDRVLNTETTFEEEARDLFYFKEKGNRWRVFVPFCSNYRKDHSRRYAELTHTINRLDLTTEQERRMQSAGYLLSSEVPNYHCEPTFRNLAGHQRVRMHNEPEASMLGYMFLYGIPAMAIIGELIAPSPRVADTLLNIGTALLFASMGVGLCSMKASGADYETFVEKSMRADRFVKDYSTNITQSRSSNS